MLDMLLPLWMRTGVFAMGEFLTGSMTSVFYTVRIDGKTRYFHAYYDVAVVHSLAGRDVRRHRRARFLVGEGHA